MTREANQCRADGSRRRRVGFGAAALLLAARAAIGQPAAGTGGPTSREAAAADAAAAPPPPARAVLEGVNREAQALYASLQESVLRVQMPAPRWVNDLAARDRDAQFNRYKLNPAVRQQLLEQQQRAAMNQVQAQQPATEPAGPQTPVAPQHDEPQRQLQRPQPVAPEGAQRESQKGQGDDAYGGNKAAAAEPRRNNVVIVVPPSSYNRATGNNGDNYLPPGVNRNNDAAAGNMAPGNASAAADDLLLGNARLQVAGAAGNNATYNGGNLLSNAGAGAGNAFAPNNIGLLLDDRGHVLVPLYIERDAVGALPVRLTGPDGELADARFVGSDQQTNLTVLRLERPGGKPVRLSKQKLEEGSLVLYLSPADGSGRLGLWNGSAGNREHGVVVAIDGQVAGIARSGQFLSGQSCQLIADQIVRHGSVRRATLGVIITQVEPDDPLRRDQPLLGDRPAVRVDQVMKGSAADRAGLKAGDLLLALAGDAEACRDIPTIAAAVARRDGHTPVRVLRGGEVLEVSVDLQPK